MPTVLPGSPKDPFGEGARSAHARRLRSLGIALALAAFVAVIFVVSIIKLTGGGHAIH